VTRFALFSACAALALLGACKEATTGGSSSTSLGTLATTAATTVEPVKNSNLVSPVVQQTYNSFSANQRLVVKGQIGADITIPTTITTITNVPTLDLLTGLPLVDPVTGQPITTQVATKTALPITQVPTAFSYGIPSGGNTIKPAAGIANTLYEGSQPQSSNSDVTIDFNPRDAVYSVKSNTASIVAETRFQDPQHRTVFNQQLVPNIANYKYAEAGTGEDISAMNANSTKREVNTIFVRDVGTGAGQTQYVTIAGFVSQKYEEKEVTRPSAPETLTVGVDFDSDISRSVFAYGLNTAYKDIPKSGSAVFAGDMFAHLVVTPQNNGTGNDLRSIVGTSTTNVDFSSGKLTLALGGNVVGFVGDTRAFVAAGAMNIFKPEKDTSTSTFSGAITSWSFGNYNVTNGIVVPTAATTIEGGFFGPGAAEIGGAFRIIGSRPDERIDFLGAFTGKKN
jgi:C-lobe and N-lobe beta barrels of Tf-binding protein B